MEPFLEIMAAFPDAKMVGGSSEVQIKVKVRTCCFGGRCSHD